MKETQRTLKESIDLVNAMLKDEFNLDDETNWGIDLEEAFQEAITLELDDSDEDYFECGSFRTSDTPSVLYRALWLCAPKSVDFSDMYKNRLFSFASVDKDFLVSVELYKFEVGLYFYTRKSKIDVTFRTGVISGMPGSDNGTTCSDPLGIAFFDMVKSAFETEHLVYGGNNFSV